MYVQVFHTNQIGSTVNNQSISCFCCRYMYCNMILLLVSNGNLKHLFFSYKTDESVTLVLMVRINKLEANLAALPEKVWTFLLMYSRAF